MNTENREYEQRISELEKKLEQSNQHLQLCKNEKDEFIYLACHDLKAPLRKLVTFTERLIQSAGEQLNEEAATWLQRIEKNVSCMQSLVDQLSVLSDIEAERRFEKCDLNEIMNEILQESECELKNNGTVIHSTSFPTLEAIPSQVKLLFKHLLENAIKFQPKGQSAEINIESDLLDSDEKINLRLPVEKLYYKIKFADNGIGFSEEDTPQVLKPFVTLHSKSDYPGNGLGLAICNKIIKMHQGKFFAKGAKPAGSIFVLILPEFHQ